MEIRTAKITDAGKAEIKRILELCGKPDHSVEAWAADIAERLESRDEGEDLSVEMTRLREPRGYIPFFDGSDPNFVEITVEEIED